MTDEKTPQEAHALLQQGWAYLDIRTPGEFDGGHPTGAVNVPIALLGPGGMMPNPMFLQVVGRMYPKDTRLVVGGAGGERAGRACQMLALGGYTSVVHMVGGYDGVRNSWGAVEIAGWAGSGLPTTNGPDDGSYAAVQARLHAAARKPE